MFHCTVSLLIWIELADLQIGYHGKNSLNSGPKKVILPFISLYWGLVSDYRD